MIPSLKFNRGLQVQEEKRINVSGPNKTIPLHGGFSEIWGPKDFVSYGYVSTILLYLPNSAPPPPSLQGLSDDSRISTRSTIQERTRERRTKISRDYWWNLYSYRTSLVGIRSYYLCPRDSRSYDGITETRGTKTWQHTPSRYLRIKQIRWKYTSSWVRGRDTVCHTIVKLQSNGDKVYS